MDRVSLMIPVAIAVGVIGGYAGMIIMTLDTPHPVSPQASVALSVIALFFLALPVRWFRTRFAGGREATGRDDTPTAATVGGAA